MFIVNFFTLYLLQYPHILKIHIKTKEHVIRRQIFDVKKSSFSLFIV